MRSVIALIVEICLLGALSLLVSRYLPIQQGFKTAVYIVCIIVAVALILAFFGINLLGAPALKG